MRSIAQLEKILSSHISRINQMRQLQKSSTIENQVNIWMCQVDTHHNKTSGKDFCKKQVQEMTKILRKALCIINPTEVLMELHLNRLAFRTKVRKLWYHSLFQGHRDCLQEVRTIKNTKIVVNSSEKCYCLLTMKSTKVRSVTTSDLVVLYHQCFLIVIPPGDQHQFKLNFMAQIQWDSL